MFFLLKKVRATGDGPNCIKCYCCATLKADAFYSLALFIREVMVLLRWIFFSPDACQAIKDDDLVLFFSPCFCATVQSNSSSPWVKNLASLLMVCTSTELITKAFSTVNFTQILWVHKVCAKNLNVENV